MAKFFLLLGKNNGYKRRNFSSFFSVNFETRVYSSVFSVLSPIFSDGNKIPSDVFKIPKGRNYIYIVLHLYLKQYKCKIVIYGQNRDKIAKKIGGRAVFCASPWCLGLGGVSPKQIACF